MKRPEGSLLVMKVNTEQLMKAMKGRHEMYGGRMAFERTPFMYHFETIQVGEMRRFPLGLENSVGRVPCAAIKKIGVDRYKLAWYSVRADSEEDSDSDSDD